MASHLEKTFEMHIRGLELNGYQTEYRLAANYVGLGKGLRVRLKDAGLQDWRHDFIWLDQKLIVELNGGTFNQGRHTRGAALASEYRKINFAQEQGFNVLIFDSGMVKSGEAAQQVERFLK